MARTLTAGSVWPDGDFRNIYFKPENLHATLERVERLRGAVPDGMSLPELALRFILGAPEVSTIIPGMRKLQNVEQNIGTSGQGELASDVMAEIRTHRWDRRSDVE